MSRIDAVTLANKDYVAELYRRYQEDPNSVDEQWSTFFAGFELGIETNGTGGSAAEVEGAGVAPVASESAVAPVIGIYDLIHSYREIGHLVAHLNPLADPPTGHPLLEPAEFGFGEGDLDRVVRCGNFRGCDEATIGQLIERLKATYCRTIG